MPKTAETRVQTERDADRDTTPRGLRVVLVPPREVGLKDLLLVGRGDAWHPSTRTFLYARRDLLFGYAGQLGDTEIPLLLRRLRVGSRMEDDESKRLNETISRLHGRLSLRPEGLCVRDESTNGMCLDGAPLRRSAWRPLPDRFTLGITAAEPVLDLEGRQFARRKGTGPLDLPWPDTEAPPSAADVGAEHDAGVDALRLRRLVNGLTHTYVQVFSRVSVGSDELAALQVADSLVAPLHAEIVLYRGEWFVHTCAPGACTEVDGHRVGAEEYVSLAPGKTLRFGGSDYLVKRVAPEAMTRA